MSGLLTGNVTRLAVALACSCVLACTASQPDQGTASQSTLVVPNGVYTLTPANGTGNRLDVSGQATADGTNVQVWVENGQLNQQFQFTSTDGTSYRIEPMHAPGQVLDVSGVSTSSGANVHIWHDLGQANQRWTLTPSGAGFTLTPTHATALRLTATGSSSASNVDVETANGSTRQVWNLTPVGGAATIADGTYTLIPANATGLQLDVAGAGTANQTNVDVATATSATNQQWIVTAAGSGAYRLSPVHAPAQALDVSGQATTSGTNIQLWQDLGQANQRWRLTPASGGFTLTPTHAVGLRLTATGTANGSSVHVDTANGSSSQVWAFQPIVATIPTAPTGLTATAGNAQISLTWTASAGAATYNLYRGTAANGEAATAVRSGIVGTSVTDTGLANGTTYYYKVRAASSAGTSGNSNEANATPSPTSTTETIGGGSLASPAVGPGAAYSLGAGFTLVKNWNFGSNGTIRNYTDMNNEFVYHSQFGGIGNDIHYGCVIVAPDPAHIAFTGAPVEGTDTGGAPVRQFLTDSLKTFLVPLYGATTIDANYPGNQMTCGDGSFMAKWKLPRGGSLLGQDLLWETRVRYVTPPYFWFALWTSGNKWDGGAEFDLIESFGYDNGGGNTNYVGKYWHSDPVGGSGTTSYSNWGNAMSSHGITNYDATQWHTWTWLYRKNNTYSAYVDGIEVQSGSINWTDGGTAGGEAIDMDFLFDGAWGHNQIPSVDHTLPASALSGKYYEWDYSRVYLK